MEGGGEVKLIENFKMEPFTRTAWVSAPARETWEPIIRSCSAMVSDLEVESVSAGQRPCSWQTIKREDLPAFTKRCADKRLIVMPVQWVGSFDGFIHYTPPGDAMAYCIIAKEIGEAVKFREAFEKSDHETQGEQLGFPKCCREAFAANWKAGFFDPIWQSATSDVAYFPEDARNIGKCAAHPYSIPLLRYVGLRVGFHIPHSFSCAETIAAGRERLSLAKDQELVKLLEALLSMPMHAELFHGILTVRTPLFYIIQYSVPTEEKYIIDVDGKFIPKEGAWPARAKR
jgi:hypothetical protein